MRYKQSPLNPAGTAIAAVLALAPICAVAQTAEGAQSPPPVTSSPTLPATTPPPALPTASPQSTDIGAPATSPPAQPVFAPRTPVVQQVPPGPATAPATAVETESADQPAVPPARSSRPVAIEKSASDANGNVTRSSATTPQSDARPLTEKPADPVLAVQSMPGTPQTTAMQPAAQAPEQSASEELGNHNDSAGWALGLGALALVGGAGVVALMSGRRRRRGRDIIADKDMAANRAASASLRPVGVGRAIDAEDRKPVPAKPVVDPLAATLAADKPVFSQLSREDGSLRVRREAMIAAAPSAENPFRTRKNRLRRANFILRQENMAQGEASRVTAASREEAIETARQARPQLQTSYRFSSGKRPAPAFRPKYS